MLSAIVLYVIAQKFKITEDPRIDLVEAALPLANCGGCGYPGCRNFAETCVKSSDLETLFCPVGGNAIMKEVAKILGKAVIEKEAMVAVIRCNGSLQNREKKNKYDSIESCRIISSLFRGETGCQYGCLGLGDCVNVCNFGAIYIDKERGLPVVIEEKCVSCGACVKSCPRKIIELRKKGPKSRRVFVSCVNKEVGGVAKSNCDAACIGCGKCFKECPFGAITIERSLAYIDFEKCKLCRKCVNVCPTNAIWETNFPPIKTEEQPTTGSV
jgi:RnfABCDGE-type electron transport complex B subunit